MFPSGAARHLQLQAGHNPSQRVYVQQDANWDEKALVSTSGSVLERYVYDPYGAVSYLNASWGTITSSGYSWIYQFQAHYLKPIRLLNLRHSMLLGRPGTNPGPVQTWRWFNSRYNVGWLCGIVAK